MGWLRAIETNCAAVTVSTADPVMLPEVAVNVADPSPVLDASPVALMVATAIASELQLTVVVMS